MSDSPEALRWNNDSDKVGMEGGIRAFTSQQEVNEAIEAGYELVTIDKEPDPSCGKCYGRGWSGKDLKTGMCVPCQCVLGI